MTNAEYLDEPPLGAALSPIRRISKLYLRLLDAEAEGAAEEMVELLFGLDPAAEPRRAV